MGLFKKTPDIDFTDLEKRGLIKKQLAKAESKLKVNSQGFVEFPAQSPSGSVSPSQDSSVSPFGFLDSIASSPASSTSSVYPSNSAQSPDFANLRVQVDNLDFKLGTLMERLEKIESKLIEFENKTQGFKI